MSKKSGPWWVSRCHSLAPILLCCCLTNCDRGASNEIGVARRFADAVARNNAATRDSMIATQKFKEYFSNAYVGHDMMEWFRTFYDYKDQHFRTEPTADVDRHLEHELDGALLDTNQIEETGMVRIKSPTPGDDAAYFWMVRQHNKPWMVAIVTKGESQVNFR